MPGPTRRPGPGPWRYGGLKSVGTAQPKSSGTPAQVFRPTVITQYRPRQWQGDPIWPNIATLTAVAPLVQNFELNAPPQKKWAEVIEGQQYLDYPLVSFNYDYPQWNVKGFPSDAPYYNLALLTPPAVVSNVVVRTPLTFEWRMPWRGQDFTFPNIASITLTVAPQPPTTVDAGRHHKRYKVKLGSRTVYFATKAEAVAARERHREVLIIEAKAAGVDPRKIKVRRPRITRVSLDGRHPPDLAPAKQIERSHNEILPALNEARMREEEEIAIALLLS